MFLSYCKGTQYDLLLTDGHTYRYQATKRDVFFVLEIECFILYLLEHRIW